MPCALHRTTPSRRILVFETIKRETQALRQSDVDDITFAIEAIRINLSAWAYKDETLLLEAMQRLQQLKEKTDVSS